VLWTPLLPNDNKFTAQRATRYLADSRVSHFWDTWSYGKNQYHQKFGAPLLESWDLFVLSTLLVDGLGSAASTTV